MTFVLQVDKRPSSRVSKMTTRKNKQHPKPKQGNCIDYVIMPQQERSMRLDVTASLTDFVSPWKHFSHCLWLYTYGVEMQFRQARWVPGDKRPMKQRKRFGGKKDTA